MFCAETPKRSKAARNCSPLRARAAPSRAVISSVGSWPTQRSAITSPARRGSTVASVTTGPCGVTRTWRSALNHRRWRMRTVWVRNSSAGRVETSNRSDDAARMLVPPQAMSALRPIARNGSPGTISPTAWKDGDRIPAASHTLGWISPRCGSEPISAPPVADRRAATATVFDPARPLPARMSRITARRRSGGSAASGAEDPAATVRSHSRAKPGDPRAGSSAKYPSQFTSVPASRPIASRSSSVKGSRDRPSNPNSGGARPFITAWFSPAVKAAIRVRVSSGQAARIAGAARPKSRMRSAWSISVANGPAASDSRPRAASRSSAICAPRRCPCTRPSA